MEDLVTIKVPSNDWRIHQGSSSRNHRYQRNFFVLCPVIIIADAEGQTCQTSRMCYGNPGIQDVWVFGAAGKLGFYLGSIRLPKLNKNELEWIQVFPKFTSNMMSEKRSGKNPSVILLSTSNLYQYWCPGRKQSPCEERLENVMRHTDTRYLYYIRSFQYFCGAKQQNHKPMFAENVQQTLAAQSWLAGATCQLSVEELLHQACELAEAPLTALQTQVKKDDSPVEDPQTNMDRQLAAIKTVSIRQAGTCRWPNFGVDDHWKNQYRRSRPMVNNKILDYSMFPGWVVIISGIHAGRFVDSGEHGLCVFGTGSGLLYGEGVHMHTSRAHANYRAGILINLLCLIEIASISGNIALTNRKSLATFSCTNNNRVHMHTSRAHANYRAGILINLLCLIEIASISGNIALTNRKSLATFSCTNNNRNYNLNYVNLHFLYHNKINLNHEISTRRHHVWAFHDVRVEGMLRKAGSPLAWTSNYDDRTSSDFKDVETATCRSLLKAIDSYTVIAASACKLMHLYEGSVYAVSNLAFDESALITAGIDYSTESFHELIRNAIEAYSDPEQDAEFQAPVIVRGYPNNGTNYAFRSTFYITELYLKRPLLTGDNQHVCSPDLETKWYTEPDSGYKFACCSWNLFFMHLKETGQMLRPGNVRTLVLPSGGVAVRYQKGATAERFNQDLMESSIIHALKSNIRHMRPRNPRGNEIVCPPFERMRERNGNPGYPLHNSDDILIAYVTFATKPHSSSTITPTICTNKFTIIFYNGYVADCRNVLRTCLPHNLDAWRSKSIQLNICTAD
ncbi:hypothetical protein CLF_110803 [Clonorchis sinensis]|uniref:Uncharacterized protein n=1 Tax=Clonorchis sinensis TaxID=79923 RepID=G7YTW4_CLOSI|nr:hypothetical protein CLF_110803 [Clonorchis sinensis]